MSEHYPNQREIEFALNNLKRHEQELDLHERLILRNFKKAAIDEQKQILSHTLERAQNYNNTIIAVGYTAFFAAWAFFQGRYQSALYDASLLIMLFSVMVFVLWNVFSNINSGNEMFQKAEIISRNINDPLYLFEALASFDKALLETYNASQNMVEDFSLFFDSSPLGHLSDRSTLQLPAAANFRGRRASHAPDAVTVPS